METSETRNASLDRAERHESDTDRSAAVLRLAFDEVVEYDCANETCRVVYSLHRPPADAHRRFPFADALNRWMSNIPCAEDRECLQVAVDTCVASRDNDPVTCMYRLRADGRTSWCQTTVLKLSPERILWCNKDVSDDVSNEDRRMSKRIADIVGKLPVGVGVYRYTESGAYPLYLSDRMCTMLGRSREEYDEIIASGMPMLLENSIVRPDQKLVIDEAIENGIDFEFEADHGNGARATIHLQGTAVFEPNSETARDEGDTVLYIVATDVTAEVQERRAAAWLNERYRILSELTHAISFDYDIEADTVFLYIDRTGEGMETQIIPRYYETLTETRCGVVHPDGVATVRAMFERVREGDKGEAIEYQADYYGRGYAWYRTNLFVVSDDYGSMHLVGLIENVQNEFDLRKRAEVDETTGLVNHATAKALVNVALADPSVRSDSVCAVLDIDDFKQVNDTYGHIEGDALLHEVGFVLRSSFRETDILGRVGGDEFMALLRNIDLEVALSKLRAVSQRVSEYALPQGGDALSLSIGVYRIGPDDATYRDAFVKADEALYQAKRGGKNRIVVFGSKEGATADSALSSHP